VAVGGVGEGAAAQTWRHTPLSERAGAAREGAGAHLLSGSTASVSTSPPCAAAPRRPPARPPRTGPRHLACGGAAAAGRARASAQGCSSCRGPGAGSGYARPGGRRPRRPRRARAAVGACRAAAARRARTQLQRGRLGRQGVERKLEQRVALRLAQGLPVRTRELQPLFAVRQHLLRLRRRERRRRREPVSLPGSSMQRHDSRVRPRHRRPRRPRHAAGSHAPRAPSRACRPAASCRPSSVPWQMSGSAGRPGPPRQPPRCSRAAAAVRTQPRSREPRASPGARAERRLLSHVVTHAH
jgi:hypothetical protein